MSFVRFEPIKLSLVDLLQGDIRLATPPEIYARLHALIKLPDTSMTTLAEVIEHDPALCAHILKLANSAFFALPEPVHDIPEAIHYLGIRNVQDVVLATEVIQRFDGIPPELVDIYAFWRDSLRCAVISRQMALVSPHAAHERQLFLAGLLHRIGHLVMYWRIPELSRKVLLEHRHRQQPVHEVEQELMGFDYSEVGAALMRQWRLPELLCSLLAQQLRHEPPDAYPAESALLQLAVGLSAAGTFCADHLADGLPRQSGLWERSGVNMDQLPAILGESELAYQGGLALIH